MSLKFYLKRFHGHQQVWQPWLSLVVKIVNRETLKKEKNRETQNRQIICQIFASIFCWNCRLTSNCCDLFRHLSPSSPAWLEGPGTSTTSSATAGARFRSIANTGSVKPSSWLKTSRRTGGMFWSPSTEDSMLDQVRFLARSFVIDPS